MQNSTVMIRILRRPIGDISESVKLTLVTNNSTVMFKNWTEMLHFAAQFSV